MSNSLIHSPLHASAWRASITPPPGLRLVGYLDRDVPAERVNDPLTATALALRDLAGGELVMVCCDTLGVPVALAAKVRSSIGEACGIPKRSVWISPSHTHSAPPTDPGPHATDLERDWVERLISQLIDVALGAWATLAPARVRVAVCDIDLGINRRLLGSDGRVSEMAPAPGRPVDRRITGVALERNDGEPLACLVNVACHPVACGRETRYVSADYPGALRDALEAGGIGLCAFTLGACGDVNPRGGIQADPRHAQELGRQAAHELLGALEHAPVEAATALGIARCVVAVRYAAPGDGEESGLKHLTEATGCTPAQLDELLDRRFPWTATVHDDVVNAELLVARLGPIRLAAVPYELFAATGQRLLEVLGFQGVVMTLTNASIGYLPPADELPLGGYEVDESFLLYRLPGPPAASAEADVIEAIRQLVRELEP